MITTVLTLLGAWLVLAALATAACALVVRGGRDEDRRRLRRRLRRPAAPTRMCVPRPRITTR